MVWWCWTSTATCGVRQGRGAKDPHSLWASLLPPSSCVAHTATSAEPLSYKEAEQPERAPT